ncbi:hypothetical protein K437DRAFT_259218 [Tilletiaria anomala UBC 951]|uniref:Autophagy-related protein 3 n=1 Tax=Tilletiaria anomala (strain ATCC 24038 / CBS 436.72 / UBC 951) TaxID=1037660 RepID=A0A066VC21_TILAU|nr:uncharacterized protein K437DRAFT_259218 [Tilletiaria anomala UBC 951]KDN39016.1 hypothetical protein K437DRAFT_259218 [Tilletiaria anomala UBC 951]
MNALQTHFWAVRDYLSPVLRESKFKEHGRITPEEFVAAGDFLTYKFPTWSWAVGDNSKLRDFLPSDKQYLISRGVPCLRRVSQMESAAVGKKSKANQCTSSEARGAAGEEDEEYFMESGELGGKDDEWLGTRVDGDGGRSGSGLQDIVDIPDDDTSAPATALTAGEEDDLANRISGITVNHADGEPGLAGEDEIVGDILDIPDEDDEDLGGMGAGVEEADDPAAASASRETVIPPTSGSKPLPAVPGRDNGGAGLANLLSVRTYDCLITYDKYYQTPRMWLVGYDEHGRPLKPAQIFEDVSSDYAQKTVTIEPFPHSATMSTASIHPCKHANVMKKVIERMNVSIVEVQRKAKKDKKKGWGLGGAVRKVTGSKAGEIAGKDKDSGGSAGDGASTPVAVEGEGDDGEVEGLRVDQYLIIFLKFMASIVPAIEIDATQAM